MWFNCDVINVCVCKDKGFGYTLFLQAFPMYALGAAVTKQLDYADAMQHFSNCISVANGSRAEGRTALLAVIYDAKARSWKLV